MIKDNEYKILGVNSTDDMSVIKVAFRKLASKYHPDKNNDSDESNKDFSKESNQHMNTLEIIEKMNNTDFHKPVMQNEAIEQSINK